MTSRTSTPVPDPPGTEMVPASVRLAMPPLEVNSVVVVVVVVVTVGGVVTTMVVAVSVDISAVVDVRVVVDS